jgi:hypothetical protein
LLSQTPELNPIFGSPRPVEAIVSDAHLTR